MLQITTESKAKKVEIDGLGYDVRRPGAGEALTMQKAYREVQQLKARKDLSPTQTTRLQDLSMEVLEICLKVFKPHNKEGEDYLQVLDVEVLMNVLEQLYSEEEATDEKAPATTT